MLLLKITPAEDFSQCCQSVHWMLVNTYTTNKKLFKLRFESDILPDKFNIMDCKNIKKCTTFLKTCP
jgi:hypothetical protein